MKLLFTILLLIPLCLSAQTSYDRYSQNPKIDASTYKNTSQDAIIKKLVADTLAQSKRIALLEASLKTTQATVANLATKFSAITKSFNDSLTNLKTLVMSLTVTLSITQFSVVNQVATLTLLPLILQRLTELEKSVIGINKATE